MTRGPWRHPGEESLNLYPGLCVDDGRVSGSITVDASRLPLWCFIGTALEGGWDQVEAGWSPTEHYGYTQDDLADFLHDLLELRGEYGRLLLVLADAERSDRRGRCRGPWWETAKHRRRVARQMRRCLATLEDNQ